MTTNDLDATPDLTPHEAVHEAYRTLLALLIAQLDQAGLIDARQLEATLFAALDHVTEHPRALGEMARLFGFVQELSRAWNIPPATDATPPA